MIRASQVVALLVAVLSTSTATSNDQQMMEAHLGTAVPTRKVKVYQFMLPEKTFGPFQKITKKYAQEDHIQIGIQNHRPIVSSQRVRIPSPAVIPGQRRGGLADM